MSAIEGRATRRAAGSTPLTRRLADLQESAFIPRELSWLSFNARVLQEAADPSVPEIQRLRYLGIFSNNLDEFFRVRVAEVRRLISVSKGANRQRPRSSSQRSRARWWRCSVTSSASITRSWRRCRRGAST
jgi:polyphosphate kinase